MTETRNPKAPILAPGTQQTKLRADGRSVLSVFKGKISEAVVESAGSSAVAYLQGNELIWILDFLQVPAFEGHLHGVLSKHFEAFGKERGRRVIVAISESMDRYRILRSTITTIGMRYRVQVHHACNSDELNKLVIEQLKR